MEPATRSVLRTSPWCGDVVPQAVLADAFARVRAEVGPGVAPVELLVPLGSAIDSLVANGIDSAIAVLEAELEAEVLDNDGQLKHAVLLMPTFKTVQLDVNATFATLTPNGKLLNPLLFWLCSHTWLKLLMPLSSVVFAVCTNLYWADLVGEAWVVPAFIVVELAHLPAVHLLNLTALREVGKSFSAWFFSCQ